MMYITHVNIQNFGPIKNASIPLQNRVYVIGGSVEGIHSTQVDSNTAGKTKFLHAMIWALYGSTPDGNQKDNVIRWGTDEVSVTLTFSNGLAITRAKKRGRNNTETLDIQLDGDPNVAELATKEVDLSTKQEILEKYCLKISGKLFNHAKYIGVVQDSSRTDFLFMTPAERLNVVDSIFGGDVYKDGQKVVYEKMKVCEAAITEAQAKAEMVQSQIDQSRTLVNDLLNAEAPVKIDHSKEIEEYSRYSAEEKDKLAVLTSQMEEANTRVSEAYNEICRYSADMVHSRVTGVGAGEKCPTCKQVLSEKNYNDLKSKYAIALKAHEKATDRHDAEKEARDKIKYEIHESRELIQQYDAYVVRLQEEMRSQEIALSTENSMREQRIKEEQTEIGRKQASVRVYHQEIQAAQDELKHLQFWHNGFSSSGIRSMLLDDIRNSLTRNTKYWLDPLMPELSISFPSVGRREGFNVEVKKNGSTVMLRDLSTGEARRVNIACLLGLSTTVSNLCSSPLDILIMDDVYGNLDDSGISTLSDVLTTVLDSNFEQVFIAIPRDTDEYDILVRNRSGVSSVLLVGG